MEKPHIFILRVCDCEAGETVKTFEPIRGERAFERVERGVLMQMDRERFYTAFDEYTAEEWEERKAPSAGVEGRA